jgi:hypothetical protein
MGLTIQEVLVSAAGAFLAKHRVPVYVRQAVSRLLGCRTAAMGYHARRCPRGHFEQVCYNSCRHRSCPQCGWLQTERWLAVERERLLACPHFHVIFTVPRQLRRLWRWNRKLFGDLLFRAAAESLQELLADGKYLGARPGMLLALHTWTQRLGLHPHIHALVSGGGLDADGQWRATRGGWLLPEKVLTAKFRGKLRALLLRALQQGKLRVPAGQRPSQIRGLLNWLGRTHVNVKVLERYEHGRGVATYLARYLRGGPLPNRRLISLQDGVVRFRYLDRRQALRSDPPQRRVARVEVLKFLYAYLQHVPPKGYTTVRRYGLYANNQVAALNAARSQLQQAAWERPRRPSWRELLERLGGSEGRGAASRCPVCGCELVCERLPAGVIRAPPTMRGEDVWATGV